MPPGVPCEFQGVWSPQNVPVSSRPTDFEAHYSDIQEAAPAEGRWPADCESAPGPSIPGPKSQPHPPQSRGPCTFLCPKDKGWAMLLWGPWSGPVFSSPSFRHLEEPRPRGTVPPLSLVCGPAVTSQKRLPRHPPSFPWDLISPLGNPLLVSPAPRPLSLSPTLCSWVLPASLL